MATLRSLTFLGIVTLVGVAVPTVHAAVFSLKPVMLNPTCVAGPIIGLTCARDSDCDSYYDPGDGVCEGVAITFTCTGGAHHGDGCSSSADCDSSPDAGDGVCGPDAAHKVAHRATCWGGTFDGDACEEHTDCFDALCVFHYEVSALPDDVIVAEIYASDWSPNGEELRGFYATINLDGFYSGGCGTVLPLGWDRPLEPTYCATDNDCPEGLVCHRGCMTGLCGGPAHRPESGAFVDTSRPDYVFFPEPPIFCDPCPCQYVVEYQYRGLGLCQPGFTCPVYEPPPKYCGTLALRVSSDACGVFDIPFAVGIDPESSRTRMYDQNFDPIVPLALERLVIDTGPIPPRATGQTDPPNCVIDARQPRKPESFALQGWRSINIQFSKTDDLSVLDKIDFDLSRVPDFPPFPMLDIDHIEIDNVAKIVTAVFTHAVTPGRWTCVEYRRRSQTYCIGSLPGDVDNDGIDTLDDVTALIDHLIDPEHYPLEEYQCDIDRSGWCTPADLLRVIDVLNGGAPYDRWLDADRLQPCPSLPPEKTLRGRPLRRMGH